MAATTSAPRLNPSLSRSWRLLLRGWANYALQPVTLLRGYTRGALGPDLLAGFTVALVMLPQAIAYASIAELPAEVGIYAAIVSAAVGALWGSSRHLHTGPTNAASLLVLSTLLPLALPGSERYIVLAGMLAVLVGVIRLAMGAARFGVLVNFVADSVMIGFTAGAGILIAANQLRHLLRLDLSSSADFLGTVAAVARAIPQTHWPSLLLGLVAVAIMLAAQKWRPVFPHAALAMVVTALMAAGLGLGSRGVLLLGEIPRALPPLRTLPLLDLSLIGELLPGAFAIAAVGLVEALSIARVIAARSGQALDSNQEFVGQGLANIATGFLSGYPTSGSFTRSAVNYDVGAKTALASVFSAGWVLVALLALAPLASYLPRTALAGVLIVTAYRMIDFGEMKRILRTSLGDSAIMVATFLAALFLPLEFAVLAGVLVSFGRVIVKMATPRVELVVPDLSYRHFVPQLERPACPQLATVSVSGSLYFGAAQQVESLIRANAEANPDQKHLLLRLHLVEHCDVSGIHMLESIVRFYRQRGGDVFIADVRPAVYERMQAAGFDRVLGAEHFFEGDQAISHLFHHVMDALVCIHCCPVRVFAECQALPKTLITDIPVNTPPYAERTVAIVEPSAARLKLAGGAESAPLLLDVREPEEFAQSHIAGSRPMPMRLVSVMARELPRETTILLVCRTGRRSQLAAHILRDMGFGDIYALHGGILAWTAAGYPLAVE